MRMGNASLREISSIVQIDKSELDGCKVAIDTYNWVYKYMTTTVRFTRDSEYTTPSGDELPNLIGCVKGIKKIYKYGLSPVFVFDGEYHEMKAEEIKERADKKERAEEKMRETSDEVEKAKYKARTQRLDDKVVETTRELISRMNIPIIDAPMAAEAQAAHMTTQNNDIIYSLSDDYDSILFGSEKTVRNFTGSGEKAEILRLKQTLNEYDIDRKDLIHAAILCGTDYNDGVSGVGPKTGINIVKQNKSLDSIRDKIDDKIPRAERIRELYMNPPTKDVQTYGECVNPDTTEAKAYLKGKGILSDDLSNALGDIEDESTQTGLGAF